LTRVPSASALATWYCARLIIKSRCGPLTIRAVCCPPSSRPSATTPVLISCQSAGAVSVTSYSAVSLLTKSPRPSGQPMSHVPPRTIAAIG
jgi:hypothetical protein